MLVLHEPSIKKYIITQKKGKDVKSLFFIVLLVTIIITAGCVDEKNSATVTPPQTPKDVYLTVLVTPTPLSTATDVSATSIYQTYNNNEFNFAIQYPKSWTTTGNYVTGVSTGKKYKVIFSDPTSRSSQYIRITTDSSGISVDDWASVFLSQLNTEPVQVIGQQSLQLDGISAKKLILTYGSGNDETESTIILAVKSDNAYFMEFTTRKDLYSMYSPDFDRMIETFKFT